MAETKAAKEPPRTVAVSVSLANQIKVIATYRGSTMSEVVERYAGTVIGREYRRVLAAMSAETTGEA